jgi:hypothetical protein
MQGINRRTDPDQLWDIDQTLDLAEFVGFYALGAACRNRHRRKRVMSS